LRFGVFVGCSEQAYLWIDERPIRNFGN